MNEKLDNLLTEIAADLAPEEYAKVASTLAGAGSSFSGLVESSAPLRMIAAEDCED